MNVNLHLEYALRSVSFALTASETPRQQFCNNKILSLSVSLFSVSLSLSFLFLFMNETALFSFCSCKKLSEMFRCKSDLSRPSFKSVLLLLQWTLQEDPRSLGLSLAGFGFGFHKLLLFACFTGSQDSDPFNLTRCTLKLAC